jgi:hypothetical protein
MNPKGLFCLQRHVRLSPYYERRVSQSTFEVSDQLAISMLSPPAHGILGRNSIVEVGFRIGLVRLRQVVRCRCGGFHLAKYFVDRRTSVDGVNDFLIDCLAPIDVKVAVQLPFWCDVSALHPMP